MALGRGGVDFMVRGSALFSEHQLKKDNFHSSKEEEGVLARHLDSIEITSFVCDNGLAA